MNSKFKITRVNPFDFLVSQIDPLKFRVTQISPFRFQITSIDTVVLVPPVLLSAILIDANTIELTYDKLLNESIIPDLLDYYFDYSGEFLRTTEDGDQRITEDDEDRITEDSEGAYFISNWFLPSKDELNQMYINLYLNGVGDLNIGKYWSSSEFNTTSAHSQIMASGLQSNLNKNLTAFVRACRMFSDVVGAYSLQDVGPGGGLIFYIDGNTYYEAAPSDQSASTTWSNVTALLVGTSSAIGTGRTNTAAIIAQTGHVSSAAKLCNDLIL